MWRFGGLRSLHIPQSCHRGASLHLPASQQVSHIPRNWQYRRLVSASPPPCVLFERSMASLALRFACKIQSRKAHYSTAAGFCESPACLFNRFGKTRDHFSNAIVGHRRLISGYHQNEDVLLKAFSRFGKTRDHFSNAIVGRRRLISGYHQDKDVLLKAFSRSYSYSHGFASQRGIRKGFSRFEWFYCCKEAWGRLLARPRSSIRLSRVENMVKAVSLACTRSHLPFGIAAVAFGGRSVAHAQGHAVAVPSIQASSALSSVYTIFDLCGLVARFLYLCVLFMPAVLTAPFANMLGRYAWQAWLRLVHLTLEFAGAAFIKWGQWAATRPDLFPKDLCIELQKLHSNAPAHKFSYTVKMIERAFGKTIDEIFLDFEEKPVASGSIAQVYKATLQDGVAFGKQKGPTTVAVKVRHPGVSEVIRRDFLIINCIANLSTWIPGLKWLRLDETVHQFAMFMLTQVDLAREAAHLSRFSYNFRSWRDVSFPRPVYPLVHPAVLVESFEQGESVSNYIDVSNNIRVNRKLANIGTNTILKMLLVDNFIHADMHPGNILVRVKKGTDKEKRRTRSRPHLVFLDVGLTAELAQKDRINLLEFFKSVALRDGRTAARCVLEFSNKQSCPNPDAFIKQLETSFMFWGSREANSIHPEECMQDVLEQVRRHRVNIDGDVCTVMVTIMVLEGWQRKLDPDFNMMRTLQKLLLKQDMAESLAYTINAVMAP